MMKTELRATPHTELEGQTTVELWHDGQFLGTIVGADGPGIRIFSRCKFSMHDMKETIGRLATVIEFDAPNVIEIRLHTFPSEQ